MPAINVELAHDLGQEKAKDVLKNFIDKIKSQHGDSVSNLHEQWSDNSLDFGFSTLGFKIQGKMDVDANKVRVSGTIPFAAIVFKGRIEKEIRDQLSELLRGGAGA